MRIGDTIVDFDANTIDGAQGQHIVEPKVMRLLAVLAEKPHTVFSREDLITAVWGVNFGGDERLSRAISLLRKALGEQKGQRKYIETISRRGYRLIADVSTEPIIENQENETGSPTLEPAHLEAELTPTPLAKKISPLRWIGASLVGAVAAAFIIFAFLPKTQLTAPAKQVVISESLSAGLDRVHFFGHQNAIPEAQAHFMDVLSVDPDNATAHAGLALAYIREYTALEADPTLLKQAKASALKALEENEHLALSHIAMAWSFEFERDADKALQYLERADLLDKDHELILESRIRILWEGKNFDGVKSLLNRAIELHPNNVNFSSYLSQLHFYLNELDSAEKYIKKAIALDPKNPRLYSSYAHFLHQQNKTEGAIKVIQEGLTLNETADLYNNLGTYLFFQGYYELAASAFEKTLELDGNTHRPLYWANLGDAYRWVMGKEQLSKSYYKRALELWEKGLKEAPDSLSLATRISLYEAKLSLGEKPTSLLDQVIAAENAHSVYYYRMLVTAELWGDRERALRLLKNSINSGYPKTEIRNDPELKALREDQAFHLIMLE